MNATMHMEKNGARVYVQDAGHDYDYDDLGRIIQQLEVARSWLKEDKAYRSVGSKK